MAETCRVRPAQASDRTAIRGICLKTAADGADATTLFAHPELLWAIYADPYLEHDLATCFVAEDSDGVCGYILSALDAKASYHWAEEEWLPQKLVEFSAMKPDMLIALDQAMLALLHHPFPLPDCVETYPSELHINLLPRAQKRGIGRGLIETLFHALREKGSSGVFLGVSGANQNAQGFYQHLGFVTLQCFEDGSKLMGFSLNSEQ